MRLMALLLVVPVLAGCAASGDPGPASPEEPVAPAQPQRPQTPVPPHRDGATPWQEVWVHGDAGAAAGILMDPPQDAMHRNRSVTFAVEFVTLGPAPDAAGFVAFEVGATATQAGAAFMADWHVEGLAGEVAAAFPRPPGPLRQNLTFTEDAEAGIAVFADTPARIAVRTLPPDAPARNLSTVLAEIQELGVRPADVHGRGAGVQAALYLEVAVSGAPGEPLLRLRSPGMQAPDRGPPAQVLGVGAGGDRAAFSSTLDVPVGWSTVEVLSADRSGRPLLARADGALHGHTVEHEGATLAQGPCEPAPCLEDRSAASFRWKADGGGDASIEVELEYLGPGQAIVWAFGHLGFGATMETLLGAPVTASTERPAEDMPVGPVLLRIPPAAGPFYDPAAWAAR